MTGKDFRGQVKLKEVKYDEGAVIKEELEDEETFKTIAQHLRVLARSTPEDKYALVLGLK